MLAWDMVAARNQSALGRQEEKKEGLASREKYGAERDCAVSIISSSGSPFMRPAETGTPGTNTTTTRCSRILAPTATATARMGPNPPATSGWA